MKPVLDWRSRVPEGAAPAFATVTLGLVAALGLGIALGDPTPAAMTALAAAFGLVALAWVAVKPRAGFLILAGSSILLFVVQVTGKRFANAFDVLMPAVLVGSLLRSGVRGAGALPQDHPPIELATRRMSRAAIAYFAVAALSLIPGIVRGHAAQSMDSGLMLLRGIQGAALFPLGMWWIRSRDDLRHTIQAVLVAGGAFVVVNAIALAADTRRAGITWIVNTPSGHVVGPNEAASGLLMIWVVLLARQYVRPQLGNLLGMLVAFAMIVLTQSRGGLLAWCTFNLLMLRRLGIRSILGGLLLIALALPFVPSEYVGRMARTLVLQPGSYEAYSALIRVYGWKIAERVFLANPILGVGYLGFRFVSTSYNNLPFLIVTCENIFLEIATGMGLVGLLVTGVLLARMFQLGARIRRAAPSGTLGHHLARLHAPFLISLVVTNLTADNWVGVLGIGQLALWLAILVRSGQFDAGEVV